MTLVESRMNLLRTIPWFTRLLIGLFMAAQFAGMVSSPRANALPMTAAGVLHADALPMAESAVDRPMAHHHHLHGRSDRDMPCGHHDHGGNPADTCCALHACFAGLLPLAIAIAAEAVIGQPPSASPDDLAPGAPGSRLDRPPRPLH